MKKACRTCSTPATDRAGYTGRPGASISCVRCGNGGVFHSRRIDIAISVLQCGAIDVQQIYRKSLPLNKKYAFIE
jgi:hypothetical protein